MNRTSSVTFSFPLLGECNSIGIVLLTQSFVLGCFSLLSTYMYVCICDSHLSLYHATCTMCIYVASFPLTGSTLYCALELAREVAFLRGEPILYCA